MKKLNFKKVFSGRNAVFSLLILAIVFLFGHLAFAGFGEWAGNVVGGIIAVFIRAIAAILILLVGVLMNVAAYGDFINAQAISKGWVVVRDVCNMFFVVILLVIAFATILGQEEYGAKKMLPKLIMAAVLINFSKMICGLMIDAASVVMLTFVNAFSAIGAGNILDVLGITAVTQLDPNADVTFGTIVSAYIFGLLYVIIATVVVASMLGMLVMRIVMIWILVVLSPLAFFLQAVPGKGQQYASQWWTKWSSNLIVGPVIAFFLWLSFASLQATGNVGPIGGNAASDDYLNSESTSNDAAADGGGLGTTAGTSAGMAQFVIAIGMLLGGMKIAQEVGGETGAVLGKGMAQLNKGKALAIGAVGGFAAGRAKWAGRGARNVGLSAVGGIANVGMKTDPITGKKKNSVIGGFALQWRDEMKDTRKKTRAASREKFLSKIGVGEKTAEKGKVMLENEKMQWVGRGGKNLTTGATVGATIGSGFGPIGTFVGGVAGGVVGGMVGLASGIISKRRYNKAKKDKSDYEAVDKSADEATINGINGRAKDQWTSNEEKAVVRMRKYDKNKKIIDGKDLVQNALGGNTAYTVTNQAMGNMTKKKKAAQDWVKTTSNDPDYLKNIGGAGNIYSSAGISEVWKKRLDELNSGGTDANTVISNLTNEISALNPSKTKDKNKLTELAKLISAYEKSGGTSDSATLGQLKSALINKGQDPAAYTGLVSAQYKKTGANMSVNKGSGGLQYDAFAKNSAKVPGDRNSAKDIMGASFAKINKKATELGVDYKLDDAAGVNNQVGGAKLKELSTVMSSLIDDEIKALQAAGGNTNKINQLSVAKARLDKGDVSGMSLKNTDVTYQGASDSERRNAEYNTTQHEIMHQAGAKNETAVYESADALSEAKLIGRIPKSNTESGGERYDVVVGKMIANLENAGASSEAISQAVSSQIEKWQVPNAQRVIETEKGERETVSDTAVSTEDRSNENFDKLNANLDKLTESLNKPIKSVSKNQNSPLSLSISATTFFRSMFTGLKNTVKKGDEGLGEKISPLGAMAVTEEKGAATE